MDKQAQQAYRIIVRPSIVDDDIRLYDGCALGIWRGDEPATDQHGHVFDGTDAHCLFADQDNLLDLTWSQPGDQIPTITHPDGTPAPQVTIVGAVSIDPEPDDVVARAQMTRGNNSTPGFSRGNTFPAAAYPHGFVFCTPISDARTNDWIYTWEAKKVEAFALSHQPSPWIKDRNQFQLMPFVGSPDVTPRERMMAIRHEEVTARPDNYRVRLQAASPIDSPIDVSIIPTMHGGVFGFDFPGRKGRAGVILDHPGDGTIDSWPLTDGRVAFMAQADGAWVYGETDEPARVHPASDHSGLLGLFGLGKKRPQALTLSTPAPSLHVRVVQSFVSGDQALHTFQLEMTASLDELATRAHDAWANVLGRLEITGGTREQRTAAWSNLARLYLWPSAHHENAGSNEQPRWIHASPYHPGQIVDGTLYVNNGYWDTYRTAWPMFHLLDEEHAVDLLEGTLNQFRESGWMSRWAAAGHRDSMVGTSSDAIFADADAHGLVFDEETAYRSALRNATVPSTDPLTGRKGIDDGRFDGYIERGVPEGMSWSVENANCDAAIALWSARRAERATDPAERARLQANADYFAWRRDGWLQLFDPETGFLRSRGRDGKFRPQLVFNPLNWGGSYTETNAWGMRFSAVQDGRKLAELMGGEEALGARLDESITTPETAKHPGTYLFAIHEMVEARSLRLGQFGVSNQPAHHLPFMYLHAGRPAATQEVVAELVDRVFVGSELGQGYVGDEDNGEMSAWQLFCLLGIYPLQLASGEFVLFTPTFDDARWTRPNGSTLQISATGNGPFIEAVRVNGQPWDQVTIPVEILHADCRIVVSRSATPTTWGEASRPTSPRPGPTRLAHVKSDVLSLDAPAPATVASVTFNRRPRAWRLELQTGDGWQEIAHVDPLWDDQTVPQPLSGTPITGLRVVDIQGEAKVTHLELFG